jgi:tetratricopeptide (TPR) repeat protein
MQRRGTGPLTAERYCGILAKVMKCGAWVLVPCFLAVAGPVFGQARPATPPVSAEDQKRAQEHFKRARELYLGGSYREAITELEIARKLDPKAKDLVLNLGILHEKLGKYDESIGHLKAYLEMDDVTPAERAKVETMLKRVEGAKQREALNKPAEQTGRDGGQKPKAPEGPPVMGRIDGLTIGAAALAGLGLAAGTALGVVALTSKPDDTFVTGRDGTYEDLQDDASRAHTLAIFSDVSFGIGAVALVATAWLYFGRPKDPAPTGARTTVRFTGTGLSGHF